MDSWDEILTLHVSCARCHEYNGTNGTWNNTPAGAVVDATGCPSDEDSDGVLDGIDQCPGTPAGREVDSAGCGEFEAALAQGRLILSGVQFEFNSADIKDESQADLDRAAAAIRGAIANRPGRSLNARSEFW